MPHQTVLVQQLVLTLQLPVDDPLRDLNSLTVTQSLVLRDARARNGEYPERNTAAKTTIAATPTIRIRERVLTPLRDLYSYN